MLVKAQITSRAGSVEPFPGKFDSFRSNFLRENNPDRKEEEKTPCCYGGGIACFLKFKDKLKYVLLYEKFLASPEGELRNLFKVLGLDEADLRLAVSVLGIDSQRGFYGEMGNERISKVRKLFC